MCLSSCERGPRNGPNQIQDCWHMFDASVIMVRMSDQSSHDAIMMCDKREAHNVIIRNAVLKTICFCNFPKQHQNSNIMQHVRYNHLLCDMNIWSDASDHITSGHPTTHMKHKVWSSVHGWWFRFKVLHSCLHRDVWSWSMSSLAKVFGDKCDGDVKF